MCSRGYIRSANAPCRWHRTTPLCKGVGGGTRAETSDEVTSWARSRRHGGVVDGHVRALGGIHHTTGRISRLPTTWVGQDSWEEGDVSGWAKGQTTRW